MSTPMNPMQPGEQPQGAPFNNQPQAPYGQPAYGQSPSYGAPAPQFGGQPQQFGGQPQQFGAPAPQFGGQPQQFGAGAVTFKKPEQNSFITAIVTGVAAIFLLLSCILPYAVAKSEYVDISVNKMDDGNTGVFYILTALVLAAACVLFFLKSRIPWQAFIGIAVFEGVMALIIFIDWIGDLGDFSDAAEYGLNKGFGFWLLLLAALLMIAATVMTVLFEVLPAAKSKPSNLGFQPGGFGQAPQQPFQPGGFGQAPQAPSAPQQPFQPGAYGQNPPAQAPFGQPSAPSQPSAPGAPNATGYVEPLNWNGEQPQQ